MRHSAPIWRLSKKKCGVVRLSEWRFWNTREQINNTPHRTVYQEWYNYTRRWVFVLLILVHVKFSRFPFKNKSETLLPTICRCPSGQQDKDRKCFAEYNALLGYCSHKFQQKIPESRKSFRGFTKQCCNLISYSVVFLWGNDLET